MTMKNLEKAKEVFAKLIENARPIGYVLPDKSSNIPLAANPKTVSPIDQDIETEEVSKPLAAKILPKALVEVTKTSEVLENKDNKEAAKEKPFTNSVSPVGQLTNVLSVEVKGDKEPEVYATIENRAYRVRNLMKNKLDGKLEINLRLNVANNEDLLHIDNLDFASFKHRQRFAKDAETLVGIREKVILNDMAKLLNKLEQIQREIMTLALSREKKVPEMTELEKEAAMDLLKDKNLIQRILTDFDKCGLVGEETNKLVGYLAAVSRKLQQPLAIIVQSSSAAGKSSLMDAVLDLMPEEEKHQYSAVTGQSIFYMKEKDLRHCIFAIEEQTGVQSAIYSLKLLQSEGKLKIASTIKNTDDGTLATKDYYVEGPVMIFITTTSVEIDEELLNRTIVLTVDENREQTRAIHQIQRLKDTLEGLWENHQRDKIIKVHCNAQRLLKTIAIVNPYAEKLTFADSHTRTRRDHTKYLTLIKSIALLHQYQRHIHESTRGTETKQYIEVELADIELANKLADEVLGRSLDELPPHTRKLLIELDVMVTKFAEVEGKDRSEIRFTAKDFRTWFGISFQQSRIHLERLAQMEYVIIHRAQRGQQYLYELLYDGKGKDGKPFVVGLISVDQLKSGNNSSNNDNINSNIKSVKGNTTKSQVSNKPQTGVKQVGYKFPKSASSIDE